MNHRAGPGPLSNRADFCCQRIFRIADQPKRKRTLWILPESFVIFVRRLVDLRVANDPLAELPAVFGALRADPEDSDLIFFVSSVLVDKGRNLGPAPRSPLAAVEKDNRCGRSFKGGRKLNRQAVDIFQTRLGKSCADI